MGRPLRRSVKCVTLEGNSPEIPPPANTENESLKNTIFQETDETRPDVRRIQLSGIRSARERRSIRLSKSNHPPPRDCGKYVLIRRSSAKAISQTSFKIVPQSTIPR